jgi:hypothetical protein
MHGSESLRTVGWFVTGFGVFVLTVSLFGWSLEPI